MKAGIQKYAYSFFTGALLVLGTVDIVWSVLAMKEMIALPFLLVAVVFTICIVDCYRRNPLLYAFVFSALFIFIYVMWRTKHSLFSNIHKYYRWLSAERFKETEASTQYLVITAILLGTAIGVVCYMLLKNYYVRQTLAAVILVVLIIFGITGYHVSKLTVAGYITYCFLVVIELAFRMYYRKHQNSSKQAMTSLIPVLVIVFFLLLCVPTKDTPMEWKYVKRLWKSITYTFKEMTANINIMIHPENAEFSMSFTGYSEDGELIGGLEVSNQEVLQIKLNHPIRGALYLRGNVKDTYYGTGWKNTGSGFQNNVGLTEQQVEVLELSYALERAGVWYDYEKLYSYVMNRNMDITLNDIFTNTVFLPPKTSYIGKIDNYKYEEENGNIKFTKLQGHQTTYNVRYMDFNLNSDKFRQLMKEQSGYDYATEDNVQDTAFVNDLLHSSFQIKKNITIDLNEYLSLYSDYIRKTYTALPESLPERVIMLSREITRNAATEYEKCKAIEAFLESYTYTLTPNYDKGIKDVVDSFLFEEKEGYCTYFATAFAIMARSVGIPTRYVQGFYVKENERTGQGTYLVTQADAHAWTEVYIQGIGWIPFEATPAFREDSYKPWAERSTTITSDYNSSYYGDDYLEEYMSEITNDVMPILTLEEVQEKDNSFIVRVIILFFILVLLCITLYLFILNRVRKKQYLHAGISGQILIEMTQLLKMLDALGYHRSSDETIVEYFSRILPCSYLKEEKMDRIIHSYMKVRYHEEILNEEQLKEFQEMKQYLQKQMKRIMPGMKYYIKRIHFYLAGLY